MCVYVHVCDVRSISQIMTQFSHLIAANVILPAERDRERDGQKRASLAGNSDQPLFTKIARIAARNVSLLSFNCHRTPILLSMIYLKLAHRFQSFSHRLQNLLVFR